MIQTQNKTIRHGGRYINTRFVLKVFDLRSYLHVGAILRHPGRGILRSGPHVIEPHAPSGASTLQAVLERRFWNGLRFGHRITPNCLDAVEPLSFERHFQLKTIQKSQGAMSGLYGGWRSCTILCFAKNCCTTFDECAGALSW